MKRYLLIAHLLVSGVLLSAANASPLPTVPPEALQAMHRDLAELVTRAVPPSKVDMLAFAKKHHLSCMNWKMLFECEIYLSDDDDPSPTPDTVVYALQGRMAGLLTRQYQKYESMGGLECRPVLNFGGYKACLHKSLPARDRKRIFKTIDDVYSIAN